MTAAILSSRSTATEAQIQKLITLLKLSPRHTHELRAHGVSHPAGRIADLRERGYVIDTNRVTTVDSDAFTHIGVARYSLVSCPEEGAAEVAVSGRAAA
jgi:hypothetical protein